ncbi:hypothetical protein EJB05_04151, partial [Eragrostis curvula]
MRKLNEKEGMKEVAVDRFIECPYLNRYENLPRAPVGFEEVKHVIGGLLVLRVITFSAIKSREAYEGTDGVLRPAQSLLESDVNTVAPLWYAPGDGELLGSLFKNMTFRSNANGKSFMYFSSSQDLRPIIDTRILKVLVLDEQSNICLETMQPNPMLRQSKGIKSIVMKTDQVKFKLVSIEEVELFGYDKDKLGCWSTNNMWVHLTALKTLAHHSDNEFLQLNLRGEHRCDNGRVLTEIHMDATSAVEVFSDPVIVQVPLSGSLDKNSEFGHLKKLRRLMDPSIRKGHNLTSRRHPLLRVVPCCSCFSGDCSA